MRWIIKSLLECIYEIVGGLFGLLAQPFLKNFALDIGANLRDANGPTSFSTAMSTIFKGTSFFDLAFKGLVHFCTALMILSLMFIIMIMVIELLKAMTLGPGEAEHPLSIIGRSLMAGAGVGFSYAIFVMFEWTFNAIYLKFMGIDASVMDDTDIFISLTGDSGLFSEETIKSSFPLDPLGVVGAIGDCIILLIGIIALIMIMIQFIKLVLSVLERYVLLGVLFYTCPLAFSTLASKNTSGIFKSWFKMVFSQFLLMIFGVFFINVFMMTITNGMGSLYQNSPDNGEMKYLCFIFALYAWLLIGQKVDSYLNTVGMSAAQSAGNLLGAVTGGVAAIAGAAMIGSKGLAFGDSLRKNPKTAAGQRRREESMLAKAKHAEGKRTGTDMAKDKADLTVAKESAQMQQDKKDLKENPNVFTQDAKAQSDARKQRIAENEANENAGLNTPEAMEKIAADKADDQKYKISAQGQRDKAANREDAAFNSSAKGRAAKHAANEDAVWNATTEGRNAKRAQQEDAIYNASAEGRAEKLASRKEAQENIHAAATYNNATGGDYYHDKALVEAGNVANGIENMQGDAEKANGDSSKRTAKGTVFRQDTVQKAVSEAKSKKNKV